MFETLYHLHLVLILNSIQLIRLPEVNRNIFQLGLLMFTKLPKSFLFLDSSVCYIKGRHTFSPYLIQGTIILVCFSLWLHLRLLLAI